MRGRAPRPPERVRGLCVGILVLLLAISLPAPVTAGPVPTGSGPLAPHVALPAVPAAGPSTTSFGTVVATVNLSSGLSNISPKPSALATNPDNGDLYVAEFETNNLSVVSGTPASVVATVPVGLRPDAVAYDPENTMVYVANSGSANVSVVSAATRAVVATVPVGSGPDALAFDAANGRVYVANSLSNTVSIIDASTNNVTAVVGVGTFPDGVAFVPSFGMLYVANRGSTGSPGYVSVLNVTTDLVVGQVNGMLAPSAVVWDAANGYLYAIDGNSARVVNLTTESVDANLVATCAQCTAGGAVFDPASGFFYVTDPSVASVAVGPGTYYGAGGSLGVIPVGAGADAITWSSLTGDLYVANGGSDTVSVISPQLYAVTFEESGLPSGDWSCALDGTLNIQGPALTFAEPNGTYAYTVPDLDRWAPNRAIGTVTVAGGPVFVGTSYTTLPPIPYSVVFTERGLAAGVRWAVELNASTNSSNGTQVAFHEPNGTDAYVIPAVSGYLVVNPSPPAGNVTVAGLAVIVDVTFVAVVGTQPSTSGSAPFPWLLAGELVALGAIGALVGAAFWQRSLSRKP